MTTNHPTIMKRLFITIIAILAMSQSLLSQEWTSAVDIGCVWGFRDAVAVGNGESVLGIGYAGQQDGFLVKAEKDGEYVERIVHAPGMSLCYYSAVELDDGNFMVFGVCDDSLCDPQFQRYIRVDVFDRELTPLTTRTYDVADSTFVCFSAANLGLGMLKSILSPSGTVILAAAPAYYVDDLGGYYIRALQLYELDNEGNILSRKACRTETASSIEEITYEPHSDCLLMAVDGGSFPHFYGSPGIYVFDSNLEIVSRKSMYTVQGGYGYIDVDPISDITTDGRWLDNDHLMLNTLKIRSNRRTFYYASLYVVDSALNVYGELHLPPYDSCTSMPRGTSTAYVNDSTIFAVTYSEEELGAHHYQANVILVDRHLNLLGRKVYKNWGLEYLPGQPAAFNDGGCLIPLIERENIQEGFQGYLVKMRREDIEITWDVLREGGAEARLAPYPNPAGCSVNIPLPEDAPSDARIQLFDAAGVKSLDNAIGQSGNLIRLDTGNLAPGLYLYRIVAGNRTVAEGKFVKN